MMTKDQLAAELKRIATSQISDITRAVKEGQKSIALNEVRDMAHRLNLLADAFHPRQVQSQPGEPAAETPQAA
ncbi:hypothetical protein BHAOGJBA_4077 [Methylobacterium hispanicum]|jgi:hypothetical protein|uniref:Transcriptional regulator n=1 Tax=Methylobacterium hispanicum TaxID=270350 RepID=A0AAV4ZQR4_9HYPH|nr:MULTISPECIES: hypothetical protein [Methylobacterium]GJD90537.1 hypothetical protein BHAOGJBA_4077 [Methylobacterium hispanicum]